MRFRFYHISLLLCLTAFQPAPVRSSVDAQSLNEIFKSGEVRFIQELVVTDEELPEGFYFRNPWGIAVHPNGLIYVSDFDDHNIKVLNREGKLVKIIGQEGQGPGDLYGPSFIDAAGDRIVVWEVRNRRFSILDKDGQFIESAQIASENGRPEGMKALPDGRLILLTEAQVEIDNVLQQWYRIFLLSPDLEIVKTIYSTKLQNRKLITEPMRMYVPQPFTPYVYWDITSGGGIILGCSDKYEIEIHDPDRGKLDSFTHDYKPVKVNDEDKEQHFSIFTMTVWKGNTKETKQGAPDYIKDNTAFPKLKPAFKNILTDDEGNIWVQPYHESRKMEEQVFDVFDGMGKFIRHVEIIGDSAFPSSSFKVTRIKNKTFWKIETGEDGFYSIVRYKISDR